MACSKPNLINNGCEIRQTAGAKGRGLFATRAFRSGQVILEEDPIISCQFSWNMAYGYSACNHCMKPLESAEENARRLTKNLDLALPYPEHDDIDKTSHVVCPHCAMNYCSPSCLETAWDQYHQTMCTKTLGGDSSHPLQRLEEAWKVMHYPPETTSVMLLSRILSLLLQSRDSDATKRSLLQLCHQTVNEEGEIAHKLLGVEFTNQLESLRNLSRQAFPRSEVNQFLTPEGFRSLFALVGRNGQGVGTSSFSRWVNNVTERIGANKQLDELIDSIYSDMDKESGQFLNVEGSALYSVQSASNHSCQPNSEPTFPHSNHTLVLVATDDVKENDEIFISYLDECALTRSRYSRMKILRENYLFICQCRRCLEEVDQEDVTSEDSQCEDMEED